MRNYRSLRQVLNGWRRSRLVQCIGGFLVVVLLSGPVYSADHEESIKKVKQGGENRMVMIPTSSMASDKATVTVSVLRETSASANQLLDFCQSDPDSHPQEETTRQSRFLCQLLEGLVTQLNAPRHEFQGSEYLVTIPLTQPREGVEAVTWTSRDLDGAITFLDVVQGGTLKGVRISLPSGTKDPKVDRSSCQACPIQDLIFQAAAIRDHKAFLENEGRR